METQVKILAKVNNQQIIVVQNGEKRVPIKPICEALGISYPSQFTKLKEDEILSSTIVLSTTVGADGKDREMVTIPYKYVFGWLFSINPKNVNPEAAETVKKYKMLCYDILYNHFAEMEEFLEWKDSETERALGVFQNAKSNYQTAARVMKDAEHDLKEVRSKTIIDYHEEKRQLFIPFGENKPEVILTEEEE